MHTLHLFVVTTESTIKPRTYHIAQVLQYQAPLLALRHYHDHDDNQNLNITILPCGFVAAGAIVIEHDGDGFCSEHRK